MKKLFFGVLLLICVALCLACQKKEAQAPAVKKLTVVTTLFPLYDFARAIAEIRPMSLFSSLRGSSRTLSSRNRRMS